MSENDKENSGFILYLSQQALPIRMLAFVVFIVLIIGLIVGITGALYLFNISNFPRNVPFALADTVTVEEYAVFEDEESYPAALASHSDGTVYTGSYLHGAVWRVNPSGDISEIPDSRARIGSVIGLDVASDGTVTILDRYDAFIGGGAKIWQLSGDTLQEIIRIEAQGTIAAVNPNDIAVSADGRIFVVDIALQHILVLENGELTIWWQAPDISYQPAGLAYDAANERLLVTDAARTAVYAIPVNADNPEAARETIYINDTTQTPPQFNGITVDTLGNIYVAALGLNEIWQIDEGNDDFTILANNYRGSSDLAYDASNGRLFVNNWDQSWLLPINFAFFQFNLDPRLPFSVDVINLNIASE